MGDADRKAKDRTRDREQERAWWVGGFVAVLGITVRRGAIPLTDPNSPGCDDPRGDAEDQQHGARADGHEGFHDEARVEVDLVEGTYTTRRSVGE